MYGRVVTKHKRRNLCIDEKAQTADIAHGKGTVLAWSEVPGLARVRELICGWLPELKLQPVAELNYYHHGEAGIGPHGDTERKVVVGLRVRERDETDPDNALDVPPLCFHWYHRGQPVGKRVVIPLHHGDIYLMSEKAVGSDWLSPTLYTLRHATGTEKDVSFAPKPKKPIKPRASSSSCSSSSSTKKHSNQ
jgi:hypothetical protein